LPGIPNVLDLVGILLKSLFWSPAHEWAAEKTVQVQWLLERHEFEYGITAVPLVLVLGAAVGAWKWRLPPRIRWPEFSAVVVLLAVPLALNFYEPSWSSFLKQVPIVRSSSTLTRWFIAYVPVFILGGIWAFHQVFKDHKLQRMVAVAGVALAVGLHAGADRAFYRNQSFDARPISAAYHRVKQTGLVPRIERVGALREGPYGRSLAPNSSLAFGVSAVPCFEPLFGYRLERFPIAQLKPGASLQNDGRVFNMKNPACYVFPEENRCQVGQHFALAQRSEVQAFVQYRPFSFEVSASQRIAGWLNVAAIFAVATLGATSLGNLLVRFARRSRRRLRHPRAPARPTAGR
jgi:hypothetical protein